MAFKNEMEQNIFFFFFGGGGNSSSYSDNLSLSEVINHTTGRTGTHMGSY